MVIYFTAPFNPTTMIIGIDPSFSSTGVAVLSEDLSIVESMTFKNGAANGLRVYDSVTNIHLISNDLIENLKIVVEKYPNSDFIVEFPAFATQSGSYLGIMHGFIAAFLNENPKVASVWYVPPTACNSFSKNVSKTKTYLVKFVKNIYPQIKRMNNDEATAVILGRLLHAIRTGKYKNKYFKYETIRRNI